MCMFHEALKALDANEAELAPTIVALAGLQRGCGLLLGISGAEPHGGASADLKTVFTAARDPYGLLKVLLSYPADQGHGKCGVRSLRARLAEIRVRVAFDTPDTGVFGPLLSTAPLTGSQTLRVVAFAGHRNRPEFLDWFRTNQSGDSGSVPIRALERIALEAGTVGVQLLAMKADQLPEALALIEADGSTAARTSVPLGMTPSGTGGCCKTD